MADEYNKELCNEKHTALHEWLTKTEFGVEVNRKAINGQKNWIIAVLVAVILNGILVALK